MPDQTPASPPILARLGGGIPVRCHEHLAMLDHGPAATAPWAELVSEGLRLGDWCCFLAPATLQDNLLDRLRELRVDVELHLSRGTLRCPRDLADPPRWLAWARRFFAEAEAAHAPAVRWMQAGIGPQLPGMPDSRFFECHAQLNFLVKHYPSVVLCRYDAGSLGISHLFSAITVHRHLLVEGTLVRDHPFYIPAERFIVLSPADRDRDLRTAFREVGFDLKRLLSTLAGYGQIQKASSPGL